LQEESDHLRRKFNLTYTDDSEFRKLERTFERPASFGLKQLDECKKAVSAGLEVIASSIHIHVRPSGWDKADGLRAAIEAIGPKHTGTVPNLIVVGDSANDIPLFDAYLETSIGVANVRKFVGELRGHSPRFVTEGGYATGFHEIVERILEAKRG
jgi:hydroxymethylpyrimidine pyrophosphatase-like HAD family hydrolase